MNSECSECGASITSAGGRGPTKRLCSPRCRKRASRRKHQGLPTTMTSRRAWTRADGKRPVMVSGRFASSTNPATWATFQEVQQGAGDGFGIMLGGGLGVYDLDGAIDAGGGVKPWARDVLDQVVEPVLFTEVSVSGRGIHVFVEAPEGRGSRRVVGDGSVEFYSRGRFVRVTGDRLGAA